MGSLSFLFPGLSLQTIKITKHFILFLLDVFHWMCLNKYAQQRPPNTAPAGYSCPTCNTCIFPPNNMATPVAESLCTLLQQVNWARAGLGLPLVG